MNEITEKVLSKVSEICGEECKPTDTFEGLGLDSLDCIELQIWASSMGAEMSDDVWEKAKADKDTTVGDFIKFIETKV